MTPRPRAATQCRRVQLSLDGVETVVVLTATEERRFRLRLTPYVAAARPVPDVGPVGLQAAMRSARLRALAPTAEPTAR